VAISYNNSVIAGIAKLIKKKYIFFYEIATLPMVARNDIIPSSWDMKKEESYLNI